MPAPSRFSPRSLAVNAGVAVLYYYAARLGLSLAFVNESATAFWPCTGLAIAAMLVFGRDVWQGIFVGALLVNYSIDRHPAVALGIAAGNTLEAFVAWWAVRRRIGDGDPFGRPSSVFAFALVAALAAVVSSVVGVTSLFLGGLAPRASLWDVWHTWWLGDFVSALIVTPFLVVWARSRTEWKDVAPLLLVFAAVAAVTQVVFGGWFPGTVKDYPLEYLCLPLVIWAAFAMRQRGAHTAVFMMSWLAVRGTLRGYGPFALAEHPHESLLLLQAFMGTIALVAMVLAALVSSLESRLDELKASNLALEQFAHVASHDLQEPVRKIINYGERLETKSSALSDVDRDYLSRMRHSAERMKTLLEDVLRYTKASSAESFEEVDLRQVVDDVLTDLELPIARTGASVDVRPGLPRVRASRSQLHHLVQNLVSNALKFHRPGVPPRVTIGGRALDGHVEFFVSDEGVGFDSKYAKKIFEPFQCLHRRGEYEGNGIGLSIVQKIVDNHGGVISARSVEGEGATFTVRLPASK